ncbi:competence type IV pilus ATPase ComGA [Solibacillus palustris]
MEQKCIQLIKQAIDFQASDVHLLPREDHYQLMFRKYGYFQKIRDISNDLSIRMISYFKFLSSLDISEKRKPQSGAFQRQFQDFQYSLRISTLPSACQKESLAIRILKQNHSMPLHELCHFRETAQLLESLVQHESGLILVSGVTGSGKTTTLYSLLHYCAYQLNRHVITIEDPVESIQSELLQIQVNEKAGISYATSLKAILRHSPQVLMIGEIRDKETAKIAIESAFTGHLVISTIHAKDSINSLYRLHDLSVSYEEMRQMLRAVVCQTLIERGGEYKALFEMLHDKELVNVIEAIRNDLSYALSADATLVGQKKKLSGGCYEYTSN